MKAGGLLVGCMMFAALFAGVFGAGCLTDEEVKQIGSIVPFYLIKENLIKSVQIEGEDYLNSEGFWCAEPFGILVYDNNNKPLENAMVTLSGCGLASSQATNSEGKVFFSNQTFRLPSGSLGGNVTIRATKADYGDGNTLLPVVRGPKGQFNATNPDSVIIDKINIYNGTTNQKILSVELDENDTHNQEASWSFPYTIIVEVISKTGQPMSNITVDVSGCGVSINEKTGSDGKVSIAGQTIMLALGSSTGYIFFEAYHGSYSMKVDITVARGSEDRFITGS